MASAAERPAAPGVRRAELLAALSLAIDLGLGQPMEHMLRASLLATGLADRLGLATPQRATVYYTNLVLWIGCHADSHELSRWFGDDIAFRAQSYQVDWSGLPYLRLLMRSVGRGQPATARARMTLLLLSNPRLRLAGVIHSHCQSASLLADRIGLGGDVSRGVRYAFERWDGGGLPQGVRAAAIPLETRVVQLADVAEVHLRTHGVAGAVSMARARSGRQFDPALVDLMTGCAPELLGRLPSHDVWAAALAQAPERDRLVSGDELDALLRAMGDFVDLKCPFTLGHSRAVAALAEDAARRTGLPPDAVATVRRAGFVHDLGRMGVPNSVWEKAGPLSESEQERVRLHPYLTGRILSRVRGLERETAVAQTHRERLDGSGYPNRLAGSALGVPSRILAAADTYRTWVEPRPHRAALPAAAAADRLRREARDGRLDATAVDAVLESAGHAARRRGSWPAGLTGREVEVLRLLAGGRSAREIAETLSISRTTARHHVEHIYTKIDASNRTGASLFALRQGLVDPAPGPEDGANVP